MYKMVSKIKGIYGIKNSVTGEYYIGSAVDIDARWRTHQQELKYKCHHSDKLQAAWDKYGHKKFSLEIIEVIDDSHNITLAEREQYWILHYDSYHKGYNATPVASRPHTLTDRERENRDASMAFEKYYGIYEPKYIKQIRSQPLEYDEEAQKIWEIEFSKVNKQRNFYRLVGWLLFFLGNISYILYMIFYQIFPALMFFGIAFLTILFISLCIGSLKGEEWEKLKQVEPKGIAKQAQDNIIKAEKDKRRSRWKKGRFHCGWY